MEDSGKPAHAYQFCCSWPVSSLVSYGFLSVDHGCVRSMWRVDNGCGRASGDLFRGCVHLARTCKAASGDIFPLDHPWTQTVRRRPFHRAQRRPPSPTCSRDRAAAPPPPPRRRRSHRRAPPEGRGRYSPADVIHSGSPTPTDYFITGMQKTSRPPCPLDDLNLLELGRQPPRDFAPLRHEDSLVGWRLWGFDFGHCGITLRDLEVPCLSNSEIKSNPTSVTCGTWKSRACQIWELWGDGLWGLGGFGGFGALGALGPRCGTCKSRAFLIGKWSRPRHSCQSWT